MNLQGSLQDNCRIVVSAERREERTYAQKYLLQGTYFRQVTMRWYGSALAQVYSTVIPYQDKARL
jgi:hypothetical protein